MTRGLPNDFSIQSKRRCKHSPAELLEREADETDEALALLEREAEEDCGAELLCALLERTDEEAEEDREAEEALFEREADEEMCALLEEIRGTEADDAELLACEAEADTELLACEAELLERDADEDARTLLDDAADEERGTDAEVLCEAELELAWADVEEDAGCEADEETVTAGIK